MQTGGLRRFTWRWWLALPFSLRALWRRLTPPDQAVQGMSYWYHGALERRPVQAVFGRGAGARYVVENPGRRDPGTSTTLFELNCILMALREVDAARVLEIGTYDGNTTLNLALNVAPEGEVVTVDLPLEEGAELAIAVEDRMRNVTDRRGVGRQFQGHPASARIRQVLGDSAKLDWSSLGGPFDLAFIDGCHAYEYVKNDTEGVLSVMRPGGLVLWHDYAEMDSVSRAVDSFRPRFERLCAVEGTRIAVGLVGKGR